MPCLREYRGDPIKHFSIDLETEDNLDMGAFANQAAKVARNPKELLLTYLTWKNVVLVCSNYFLHDTLFSKFLEAGVVQEGPKSAGGIEKIKERWRLFGFSTALMDMQILNPTDSNDFKMSYLR